MRYGLDFRRKVVSELESGKVASLAEASRKYGIEGSATVKRWVVSFGKNALLGKVVRVETADERSELDRLRRSVRDLEHALAQTRMRELLAESYLEVACEDFGGGDAAAFKKKLDAALSKRRGDGGRR